MLFSRVAIVGVGLIGGSLGMALRQRNLAETVVGVVRRPETGERAQALGAVNAWTTDFAYGVTGADLVVLATPIRQILTDIARLAPLLSSGTVVTDVGSTKSEIVQAADCFLPAGQFVGSHPMAGSEQSGVDAAHAELFEKATWAITPGACTAETARAKIAELAGRVGARALILSADEHDRLVALTSHLPHVLAYALAEIGRESARQSPYLYDLAAGSWSSATRVAASAPELWVEIAMSNRALLADCLRAYGSRLDTVIEALEQADDAALLRAFGVSGR